MNFARRLTTVTAALALAAWLAAPRVQAQAAPGAPSDLTYLLSGIDLSVIWTHATGAFTHYVVDVAVAPGGPLIAQYSTATIASPAKLPERLAALRNPSAPTGTYYVKIAGANGAVLGSYSPEIAITIPGTCVAPGTPTNLTAIVRGVNSWIAWNAGTGGTPTAYVLQASTQSGANFAGGFVGQAAFGAAAFNVALPAGTYYLRAYSANPCGTSGFSNEIAVTAGVDTPATTPAPATGRLPLFDFFGDVQRLSAQAQANGLMNASVSCPSRPGYSDSDIEARKVNLNGYINYIVDNLRLIDRRFGYNAKDPRSGAPLNAVIAGDEVSYHYGRDSALRSPNVYLIDTLGGHCTGANGAPGTESFSYRVFFDEYGSWTGAGRF